MIRLLDIRHLARKKEFVMQEQFNTIYFLLSEYVEKDYCINYITFILLLFFENIGYVSLLRNNFKTLRNFNQF